ncbi:hypothetical protein [Cupriavidus numazuensis]|uniref:Uncharacterized protein n=1 Tax=Cupriavidus numazuensis TaxID=221992 RepID=A0ABM8TCH8_9BURK|nr:hypothetical protein [Cupriavidus numazuensis]CAG2136143.1 hypothetical protein LMG26411_01201 [Cupriavidus numazuensis]
MKTTITEVIAARQEAGAAYAAAAQAYLDAWVTLKAHDMACANGNVAAIDAGRGFAGLPEVVPHSEFLTASLHGGLVDRAVEQHDRIIRSLKG